MLPFKPITIDDKELITKFTLPSGYMNCDYAFANMCSWQFFYHSEYAIQDDFLFIRFFLDGHKSYMLPVGKGYIKQAIEILEKETKTDNHRLCISGVTPEAKIQLEETYPNGFRYITERDFFDYIYLREDLQFLKGKKYQPKRNHINKFKNLYNYDYRPITREMIPLCMELECKWYQANKTDEDIEDLRHENQSMVYALNHFDELNLIGGVIIVNDEIVAFTYGSPVNLETFAVHVEKADVKYEGIFSLINQEFVTHLPEQYKYINREEDLGIPGLRQSKLSYNPAILLEKNTAIKR
ncbi:MAG: phosphatidylglycerol lysyltransferase domain-containing protein [Tannerella sp.]|jgi:hypothetical protein|nr:phosphatidylglycerol lysyltransferase domain-containing protein [Tannerella sp.]